MKLNLHWKQMSCLSYSQRQGLPSLPGIYFVGNLNEPVMYVGLSRNLKARHINHHRKSQFESISDVEIRFRTLPPKMVEKIQDVDQSLKRLEKQAIDFYNPPINNTSVPCDPNPKTVHGPVYVQIHNVKESGYCAHFDAENGDELGVNTGKLTMITKAVSDSRPIFLIASGIFEDYENAQDYDLSILEKYRRERIYILISCFIPYGYEENGLYDPVFIVYGGNSRIFKSDYVVLNDMPGFSEFKKSYLCLGFTNCERSSFSETLLQLGNFN
ncbi:MAG: GIY-YIG nuclease family protein [Spirulina sp.]